MAEKCPPKSARTSRKNAELSRMFIKEEVRARCKKITEILKKSEEDRTTEDKRLLDLSPDVAKDILKRHKTRRLAQERKLEVEDERSILLQKSIALADAIQKSKSLVIYTGAGISTAASIPDYRGPNGVWTLLQQGKQIKAQDLSDAEPTYTHMAMSQLFHEKKLRHVVSQNCDGLHVRSGLPCYILSEVHGNMYLEICTECNPQREYMRLFDVTEKTGVRRHKTGRHCHRCKAHLRDTIVHFGEKSPNKDSPYNWEEAADAAEDADLVLCLGTSLKILKKYSCLWHTHIPASQRPDLFIVNLMWTPKDDSASVKINGRCDDVMKIVMHRLGYMVPTYNKFDDPIFRLATALKADEVKTTSKKILAKPESRTSTSAEYYEVDANLDVEVKDMCAKEQNNPRRRRRVKTDFYDPDTPTRTSVKRVRTKAELKQEPPGGIDSFETGMTSSETVKSEPTQWFGSNSVVNQAAMSLPCLPTDMAFNPLAQVPFSGVSWMMPNLGLMSNPLNDPLMMYASGMPGLVSPFLPQQSTSLVPSSTQEANGSMSVPDLKGDNVANNNILSESMQEHLLSSTAAEIRKTKKRRKKKSECERSNVQTSTVVEEPISTSPASEERQTDRQAYDAVALEHSYTIPPHAANSKRKARRNHREVTTHTPPQANVTDIHTGTNAQQYTTLNTLSEGGSNISNKKCPTIKQLLQKPASLNKDVSNPGSFADGSGQSMTPDLSTQEHTHLRSSVSTVEQGHMQPPMPQPGKPAAAMSDNPRLTSVPSIAQAIEMVKLRQQGTLTSDSAQAVKTTKSASNTVESAVSVKPTSSVTNYSTSNDASKKSEILSQLTSPPMAPVANVQIKTKQDFPAHVSTPAMPSVLPENNVASVKKELVTPHQTSTSRDIGMQAGDRQGENQVQEVSVATDTGSSGNVKPTLDLIDSGSPENDILSKSNHISPVITTQALQQALTQLSAVSSVAIPPKVADLVLPGMATVSASASNLPKVAQPRELTEQDQSQSQNFPDHLRQRAQQTKQELANTDRKVLSSVTWSAEAEAASSQIEQNISATNAKTDPSASRVASAMLVSELQSSPNTNAHVAVSTAECNLIPLDSSIKASSETWTNAQLKPCPAVDHPAPQKAPGVLQSTAKVAQQAAQEQVPETRSPPKASTLSSPVKKTQNKNQPTFLSPHPGGASHITTPLSPTNHQPALATPLANQATVLTPDFSDSQFLANAQLSQAYLHSMNQAYNAQLLSQMAMTQFGGFAHQIPGMSSLINPFMQDPLLQGNLALMPQVQQAQMLSSPLTNMGMPSGLSLMDPNLLGALQYGSNLLSPNGMLSQPPVSTVSQTLVNPSLSQSTIMSPSAASICAEPKRKPKESQNISSESLPNASVDVKTSNVKLASKNSDSTGAVATLCEKSPQLHQTTSHLKSSAIESKNSGVLPGSKSVEQKVNIEGKRKDRSESQDSNSATSDGTADSESPVSTPTTTSAPGWFGKGLNFKKGRRKRPK